MRGLLREFAVGVALVVGLLVAAVALVVAVGAFTPVQVPL